MERDEHANSAHDHLLALKRHRSVIVVTAAVVMVAALAVSLAQTPIYEATTDVLVEPVRRTQDVGLEDLLVPQADMVDTERLVVTSRPVAERVAEALGLTDPRTALDRVRVDAVGQTRVIRIVTSDPDPAAAAATAGAFADAYLDHRRDQTVDGLVEATSNLEARAATLRTEIAELDAADEVDDVQRDALLGQLAAVVTQISELGDATSTVTGGGAVLTPAEVPVSAISPRPVRTSLLALVLGLLLGVALALVRDHLDDVIRDEDDYKRATGGRPVLGRIPRWTDPDGGDRLAAAVEPSSLASESYRELSAGLRFLLLAHRRPADAPSGSSVDASPTDGLPVDSPAGTHRRGRAILMASATAGDGKTSTASNLAIASARVGLRTLLVDADLRRPTVARRFGLANGNGLSDLLLNGAGLREHVVDVGIDNLRVLPAGTLPPNPNELLASPLMRALEREILDHVDLVIYDTPAVLAVPDALELGRHVDVALLVARAGTTGRRQIAAAVERLEQVGTEVAGTVLNDIDARRDGYYYTYEEPDASRDRATGRDERVAPTGRRARRAARKADRTAAPSARRARKAARQAERTTRRSTRVGSGRGSWEHEDAALQQGTPDGSVAPVEVDDPTSLFDRPPATIAGQPE